MKCKICGTPHTAQSICFRCEGWLANQLLKLLPEGQKYRSWTIAAHAVDLEVAP